MDNFRINVTARGEQTLRDAMKLAFLQHAKGAKFWAVRPADEDKPLRMIFYWTDGAKDILPFGFTMDPEGCADFAGRWLAEAEYDFEPDHDGHNTKGWRIYNEGWGHVDRDWQAVVAVTPVWAMHGK